MKKISVVINTLNEEQSIATAIRSVKKIADQVIVCDMYSTDATVKIAEGLGAEVIYHKRLAFVEPARDFALSKASGDWILVLDPDEEITEELAAELKKIASGQEDVDIVKIPRKNLIFGKWMKGSMWWPDFNTRFFKKGAVAWKNIAIHRPPNTKGIEITLPERKELAITHHHYTSVSGFINRLDRYTSIQAEELHQQGTKFHWNQLIVNPANEFMGRYFANKGYLDGLHGLALALLQAVSYLVMYLKVWELEKFDERSIDVKELKQVSGQVGKDINFWLNAVTLPNGTIKRVMKRFVNKLSSL